MHRMDLDRTRAHCRQNRPMHAAASPLAIKPGHTPEESSRVEPTRWPSVPAHWCNGGQSDRQACNELRSEPATQYANRAPVGHTYLPQLNCPHVNKARRMKASHPCGAVFLSRRPSLCSDLDHFEVFLACAAFGTRPVNWNVFPASARRNSFLGQSRFFVINPATNQAHPASVFHTYVASGNRLNECMMVPVWRRDA